VCIYRSLTILSLVLGAASTQAASINTDFNTGVDAAGVPLPNGTVGVAHYTLVTATGPAVDTSFTQWTLFSISSDFHAVMNTMDFMVNNDGGPTGLRVELLGRAAEAPEPVSLLLLGAGLIALSKLRRRMR
jgi:hypothetical protein